MTGAVVWGAVLVWLLVTAAGVVAVARRGSAPPGAGAFADRVSWWLLVLALLAFLAFILHALATPPAL